MNSTNAKFMSMTSIFIVLNHCLDKGKTLLIMNNFKHRFQVTSEDIPLNI